MKGREKRHYLSYWNPLDLRFTDFPVTDFSTFSRFGIYLKVLLTSDANSLKTLMRLEHFQYYSRNLLRVTSIVLRLLFIETGTFGYILFLKSNYLGNSLNRKSIKSNHDPCQNSKRFYESMLELGRKMNSNILASKSVSANSAKPTFVATSSNRGISNEFYKSTQGN